MNEPDATAHAESAFRIGPALSKREARVLNYLVSYLTQHGYQPTVREICKACQCKSTKTVSELLASLGEKGYVELPTTTSRARAIHIVGITLTITRTVVPPGLRRARRESEPGPADDE